MQRKHNLSGNSTKRRSRPKSKKNRNHQKFHTRPNKESIKKKEETKRIRRVSRGIRKKIIRLQTKQKKINIAFGVGSELIHKLINLTGKKPLEAVDMLRIPKEHKRILRRGIQVYNSRQVA